MHINNLEASNSMLLVGFGMFGVFYLLTAFDGLSPHGFGLLGRVTIPQRIFALIGGTLLAVAPAIGTMIVKQFSVTELWIAASEFLVAGNPISFVVGIAAFIVMFSPLLALAALMKIIHDSRKAANAGSENHGLQPS